MIGQQDATCWAVQPYTDIDPRRQEWIVMVKRPRDAWPAPQITCYGMDELCEAMGEYWRKEVMQ